jgi:3-phosphoglycerate kinase
LLVLKKINFFSKECRLSSSEALEEKIDDMNMGDVLLLENLRFRREEEQNNSEFCKQLASLADIYVNDAFSSSHRKHASTYGTPKLFDIRVGVVFIRTSSHGHRYSTTQTKKFAHHRQ